MGIKILDQLRIESGMYVLNEDGTLYRDEDGKLVKAGSEETKKLNVEEKDGVLYVLEDEQNTTPDGKIKSSSASKSVNDAYENRKEAIRNAIDNAKYTKKTRTVKVDGKDVTYKIVSDDSTRDQHLVSVNGTDFEEEFIGSYIRNMNSKAVGAFFDYINEKYGVGDFPEEYKEWLYYTYDEILEMDANGRVIPDEVLEWATEQAKIYGLPTSLMEENQDSAMTGVDQKEMDEFLDGFGDTVMISEADGSMNIDKVEEEVEPEVENDDADADKEEVVKDEQPELDEDQFKEYELTSEKLNDRIMEAGTKAEKIGEEALKEAEKTAKEIKIASTITEPAVNNEAPVENNGEVAPVDNTTPNTPKKKLTGLDKLKRFKKIDEGYRDFLKDAQPILSDTIKYGELAMAGGTIMMTTGMGCMEAGIILLAAAAADIEPISKAMLIAAGTALLVEGTLIYGEGVLFLNMGNEMLTEGLLGFDELDKSEDKIDVSEADIEDAAATINGDKKGEKNQAQQDLISMKRDGAGILEQTMFFKDKSLAEIAAAEGNEILLKNIQQTVQEEFEKTAPIADAAEVMAEAINAIIRKLEEELAKLTRERDELQEKKDNYDEKLEDQEQVRKMGLEPEEIPEDEVFTAADTLKLVSLNRQVESKGAQIEQNKQKVIEIGTSAQEQIGESYTKVDTLNKELQNSEISGQNAIDYGMVTVQLGEELSAKSAMKHASGVSGMIVAFSAMTSGENAQQAGRDLNVIFDDTLVKTAHSLVSIELDQIKVEVATTVAPQGRAQAVSGEEQADGANEEGGEEGAGAPARGPLKTAMGPQGDEGSGEDAGEKITDGEAEKIQEITKDFGGDIDGSGASTLAPKGSSGNTKPSGNNTQGGAGGLGAGVSTSMSPSEATQKGNEAKAAGNSGMATAKNAAADGKKQDAEAKKTTKESERTTKQVENEYKIVSKQMNKDLKQIQKLTEQSIQAVTRQAAIQQEVNALNSQNEVAMAAIDASQAKAQATQQQGQNQGGLVGDGNGLLAPSGGAQGVDPNAVSTLQSNQGRIDALSSESNRLTTKVTKNRRSIIKLNASAMKRNKKLQKLSKEKMQIQKAAEKAEKARQEKIQKDMAVMDILGQVFSLIGTIATIIQIIALALHAIPLVGSIAAGGLQAAVIILQLISGVGAGLCTIAKGVYLCCQGDIKQGLMQIAMGIVQVVMAAVGASGAAGEVMGAASKGAQIAAQALQGVSAVASAVQGGAAIANDASILQGKGPNKDAMAVSQIAGFVGAAAGIGAGVANASGSLKGLDVEELSDAAKNIIKSDFAFKIIGAAGQAMSLSAGIATMANGGKQNKTTAILGAIGSSLSTVGALGSMGTGLAKQSNEMKKIDSGDVNKLQLAKANLAGGVLNMVGSAASGIANISTAFKQATGKKAGDFEQYMAMTGGIFSTAGAAINMGTAIAEKKEEKEEQPSKDSDTGSDETQSTTPTSETGVETEKQPKDNTVTSGDKSPKAKKADKEKGQTQEKVTTQKTVDLNDETKRAQAASTNIKNSQFASQIIGFAAQLTSAIASISATVKAANGVKNSDPEKYLQLIGQSLSAVSSVMNMANRLAENVESSKQKDLAERDKVKDYLNNNGQQGKATAIDNGSMSLEDFKKIQDDMKLENKVEALKKTYATQGKDISEEEIKKEAKSIVNNEDSEEKRKQREEFAAISTSGTSEITNMIQQIATTAESIGKTEATSKTSNYDFARGQRLLNSVKKRHRRHDSRMARI